MTFCEFINIVYFAIGEPAAMVTSQTLYNHAADFFRVLGNQIDYTLPQVAFRLDMQSIHFLQVMIILIGMFFSLAVSNKQMRLFPPDRVAPAFFRFLPIFTIAIVSTALL